jgi:DNA invertase Pin-like site-specific DNA recombinase
MIGSTRACLYARYSTDRQRETSIEDQLRAARELAGRHGWEVVAVHVDQGISGSTPVALRAGGKALLADVLAGRVDVLILEGLDRLSRELGEAETMVKRLEHRGVRIIGTADGYDTRAQGRKIMRIARGLVNELYLDDLREKTHRGLAGNFDRGMSAGGRTFGYGTEDAGLAGRRMVIDPAEARIVVEVFERFADGESVRAIVHRLNERGVASSRGGTWAVSALQGSQAKRTGMLRNELYVGRVVWNRRQWIKDPDTGKRRYVDRPPEEWQTREDPSLRIVPDELWRRVQARLRVYTRTGKGAVPRTLFGGLLRCQDCGGPMIAINRERYGCNVHKDRGPTVCANGRTVLRDVVDGALLAEVRDELLAPDALTDLQALVRQELARRRADAAGGAEEAQRRRDELAGEIGRLVDGIARIGASAALVERLRQAEAEHARIVASLAQAKSEDGDVIADVGARYRRLLLQFRQVLEDEDRDRTRTLLADIIGPVTVVHEAGGVFADLEEPAARLLFAVAGESLGRVAGARNSFQRRRICLSGDCADHTLYPRGEVFQIKLLRRAEVDPIGVARLLERNLVALESRWGIKAERKSRTKKRHVMQPRYGWTSRKALPRWVDWRG